MYVWINSSQFQNRSCAMWAEKKRLFIWPVFYLPYSGSGSFSANIFLLNTTVMTDEFMWFGQDMQGTEKELLLCFIRNLQVNLWITYIYCLYRYTISCKIRDQTSNSAKDEGLGACAQTRVRRRIFSLFSSWWGLKSWGQPQKIHFAFWLSLGVWWSS